MCNHREHPAFALRAAYGVAVGSCAATIVVGAAVAVFDQDLVAPTAGPASEQPRQQVTLSVHAAQAVRVMRANALDAGPVSLGKLRLPLLGTIPQRIVDDAQLWHFLDNPFGLWIEPRHSPACIRILDVAATIPHQAADQIGREAGRESVV